MTRTKIQTIIELVHRGWRAYSADPQSPVYEKLNCEFAPERDENGKKKRKRSEPYWFVRGDSFVCVGCLKACALSRPEGFILPLPIQYEERPEEPYNLTPEEMVQRKALLRIDEVSYCLNISDRTVRDWIDLGKLRRTEDYPIRVPSEDVKARMNLFME